jgi:hypothetical protein
MRTLLILLLAVDGGPSIQALCEADQADRGMVKGAPLRPWLEVKPRDAERRALITAAQARRALTSADDLACAALIFQHGESLADFEQAKAFASRAVAIDPGHTRARRLVAQATDRALMQQGLPQKYGTQSYRNDAGVFEKWPVDPTVTEAERAQWLSDASRDRPDAGQRGPGAK